jgi:hypothetical protein
VACRSEDDVDANECLEPDHPALRAAGAAAAGVKLENDMKRFARRSRARVIRQLVRRALTPPHARGILSVWKVAMLSPTLDAA